MARMDICRFPGCLDPIEHGARYCPDHREPMANAERDRLASLPNMAEWYNSHRWRSLRAQVIADQAGNCAGCGRVAALQVHHKAQPKGNPSLFWARGNLVGLCKACHEATYGR
jgi:5-methylcytosine-specific restriction endonuclease McrA